MFPLLLGLGPSELLIILAIVLLLFGGSRLAGLGKSTGRAIKEFKEETKDIKGQSKATDVNDPKPVEGQQARPAADQVREDDGVHEAEIVDPEHKKGL
ncbi:sec-independent protein translocase protein TatA [Raineyella antarctica]|uniref:Sec-independent protein translocase protein TatA n=1 Tax=Raineyella antarctica TaxID=1577474 RepID=A0A1G6GRT8_9ACTN|nr:twin-arginine translocase TatA/TatE family subunit [Raineyella antarctica]SDB84668.1 sec-independent protein translocase protein TatA [Raineyella antarctica]